MRVLYVLERWPELSQTFVAEEIEALIAQGCAVDVLAVKAGLVPEGVRLPDVDRVAYFDQPGAAERIKSAAGQIISTPATAFRQLTDGAWPPPGGSRRLRGLARLAPFRHLAAEADTIHAHFATEAADIARLLSASTGTPWSFTAHGADAYGNPADLKVRLDSASFARAASSHVANRLHEASPAARVVEIPVAVAVDRFQTGTPYSADGPVVSVGRLIEKKGFDDLIETFRAGTAGERRLVIVGDGPMRRDLEDRAAGLPVDFTGALPPAEVAAIMRGASLFALLSKVAADGDRDGLPAAIVEAMAAGLPVLSTRLPGIDEVVHPDSGVLVESSDPTGASDALRELFALGPGAREAMGASGITRSRRFEPAEVARLLLGEFSRTA